MCNEIDLNCHNYSIIINLMCAAVRHPRLKFKIAEILKIILIYRNSDDHNFSVNNLNLLKKLLFLEVIASRIIISCEVLAPATPKQQTKSFL